MLAPAPLPAPLLDRVLVMSKMGDVVYCGASERAWRASPIQPCRTELRIRGLKSTVAMTLVPSTGHRAPYSTFQYLFSTCAKAGFGRAALTRSSDWQTPSR